MAINRPTTYKSDLVVPQVIASIVEEKLTDLIKFAPYADLDTTLVGNAGDTLTFPSYDYIGDAEDVAEGEAIPYEKLTAGTTTATVKKAGKGVDITDEALLSAYGDPQAEAGRQLALAIASKVDNDVITSLRGIGAGMTVDKSSVAICGNSIADALVKFGEDLEGPFVCPIHPTQVAGIRKDDDWMKYTEMRAEQLVSGSLGSIHGVNFIVSSKVPYNAEENAFENFIFKPGAFKIIMKRDTQVESARDIDTKTTRVNLDKHYVAYLYDASKAVKMYAKAEGYTPAS